MSEEEISKKRKAEDTEVEGEEELILKKIKEEGSLDTSEVFVSNHENETQDVSHSSVSTIENTAVSFHVTDHLQEPPVADEWTEKLENSQLGDLRNQELASAEALHQEHEPIETSKPAVDTASTSPLREQETENSFALNSDYLKLPDDEKLKISTHHEVQGLPVFESKTEPSIAQVPGSVSIMREEQKIVLPPGVPSAPGYVLKADALSEDEIITETQEISTDLVGRVIGKGGEQIRDLQARSDCKVDVDQSGPAGAPKIITYQGTREKIDFAKSLVKLVCSQRSGVGQVDLPLGYAAKKQIQVPSTVIGKIIGRNGDMIKELQTKSQCKIQVDHSQANDPSAPRSVTIIGNPSAVTRAEEMVHIIIANPQADASNTIDLLIREKNQGASKWGSGPPYSTMPNGGQGMAGSSWSQTSDKYGQQSQSYGYQSSQSYGSSSSSGIGTEIFYSSKINMGRIIGSKGVTINDLQKQSGCDIQINQNVPQGRDCEITIKGTRKGIDQAKKMLNDIISMGPNHPYAGGRGGGGSTAYTSQSYSGGSYSSQTSYETPLQYAPTQNQYGQVPSTYSHHPQQQAGYQSYQPQQFTHHQAVLPQTVLQQPYQTQSYGGYQPQPQVQHQPVYYGSQQTHYVPQLSYQAPLANVVTNWKSATTPEGQTYYYNSSTGETTWEKPPGMY